LVMYAGRIIEEGPVAAVLASPRHPYTRGLLDSLPANATPGRDLVQIPGSTPSLIDLPDGCAFAPRCARAASTCGIDPPWVVDGRRAARCHFPLNRQPA
jgi:peptide/nickel transport system ATP-binding protein